MHEFRAHILTPNHNYAILLRNILGIILNTVHVYRSKLHFHKIFHFPQGYRHRNTYFQVCIGIHTSKYAFNQGHYRLDGGFQCNRIYNYVTIKEEKCVPNVQSAVLITKALGLHSYFWNNLYFIQETKLFGENITYFCLQSTNKIAVQTSTLFSTQEEGTHQEIPHAPCISSKALSDGLTMLLTVNHTAWISVPCLYFSLLADASLLNVIAGFCFSSDLRVLCLIT